MRRLGHRHVDGEVVVEREQDRLRAGDRAEHRHHEVRQAVAVPVEGRDHQRCVRGAAEKAGVRGVDQHRLIRDLGMALRGRVQLLLEHPLIDGRDRPLRPAVDARARALGGAERELRDGAADAARDPLRAQRDLVDRPRGALAPLLGAVGVADRHAHDRDRIVHAGHRPDRARDPPAGAHDHLAVDRLAQDPVGGADVVGALGRDRGGLEPEAGSAHRRGRLGHAFVGGCAPALERQVVVLELDGRAADVGIEHADRLLEQLLAGLVAVEDDDSQRFRHAPRSR